MLSSKSSKVYLKRKVEILSNEMQIINFLQQKKRVFLALPFYKLGKLDKIIRTYKQSYYVPAPVFPNYILLSNILKTGEKDFSPLKPYIFNERPHVQKAISYNFNNKIELIGYDIPKRARRGQTINIKLYFKVNASLGTDYKIFIHLDPPFGVRITGDHNPVRGLLKTRFWTPGTYILDSYNIKIPVYGFPKGIYKVYAGLFKGSKRLKILKGKNVKANKVPLGKMPIGAYKLFSCKK